MKYGTGAALVVLGTALWSCHGLIMRLIDTAGSWEVLFWRSVGLLPPLVWFIARNSEGAVIDRFRAVGWAGLTGGMGLVVAFSGAIYALQSTTVAMAVFLFSATPFVTAALSFLLLRERVRKGTWAAVGVAAVGIWLMVAEGLAQGALWGNVAALLSALGFSAFILSLRWGRQTDMLPTVVLGAVLSLGVSAVAGDPLSVSLHDGAISAAMGAITVAGGMIVYTLGVRAVPAAEASLLGLTEVLLAPVWVWLVLGETASSGTLLGGLVLIAAVAVNGLTGLRFRAPQFLPARPAKGLRRA